MSTASYQGMSTGNFIGSTTPIYRSSRQTTSSAKPIQPDEIRRAGARRGDRPVDAPPVRVGRPQSESLSQIGNVLR
jgi:hypothetical protein